LSLPRGVARLIRNQIVEGDKRHSKGPLRGTKRGADSKISNPTPSIRSGFGSCSVLSRFRRLSLDRGNPIPSGRCRRSRSLQHPHQSFRIPWRDRHENIEITGVARKSVKPYSIAATTRYSTWCFSSNSINSRKCLLRIIGFETCGGESSQTASRRVAGV